MRRVDPADAHDKRDKCKKIDDNDKKKKCLKKAKKHNRQHAAETPLDTCTPSCAGTHCGDDGCGTPCTCTAPRTCQSGLCTCPAGQDDCGGTCVPSCAPTQARIPGTCDQCCTRNTEIAVVCDTAAEVSADCCSGRCDDDGVCRGKGPGALCAFDAQCFSGICHDSGPNVGTCD
jgi:hypothetical protein